MFFWSWNRNFQAEKPIKKKYFLFSLSVYNIRICLTLVVYTWRFQRNFLNRDFFAFLNFSFSLNLYILKFLNSIDFLHIMNLFLNQFSNDWKKIEIFPFLTEITNMDGISRTSMCTSRVQKQVQLGLRIIYIHIYYTLM